MELTAAPAPAAPALPAHLDERTRTALTGQDDLLRELSAALGGPFHVLFAERFDRNVDGFARAAAELEVPLTIRYAKKANKAATWVRRCAELGIGIDVAGAGELRHALAHGVRGDRLVVTGPAKSDELLGLATAHGATVTVDDVAELDRLVRLPTGGRPVRILLRATPRAEPASRFGMSDDELDVAVAMCGHRSGAVALEGFSVHLSGYDAQPRAAEADRLATRCAEARRAGLDAGIVDIGGGFPVDYVSAESWAGFTPGPELFHSGRRFDGFYPYHSPLPGPRTLSAILRAPARDGGTLADRLRADRLRLLIEPGRALLDQAGFTVFRVQGARRRGGYTILTVDGTSLSLSEQWFSSEFLPDPVVVPAGPGGAPDRGGRFCVGGASCLESDMLTWRLVPCDRLPQVGDLLVYPNTAGYQMDSNESGFHELPLPPKVVLGPPDAALRWRFDHAPG